MKNKAKIVLGSYFVFVFYLIIFYPIRDLGNFFVWEFFIPLISIQLFSYLLILWLVMFHRKDSKTKLSLNISFEIVSIIKNVVVCVIPIYEFVLLFFFWSFRIGQLNAVSLVVSFLLSFGVTFFGYLILFFYFRVIKKKQILKTEIKDVESK